MHIPNTNLFLKTLSECEGNVEMVKGSHIRDIELFFSNENDVVSMISLIK